MDAMKRPHAAEHDGDPNDVLRDDGIDELKRRLDEAFEPPHEDAGDPGPGSDETQAEADFEQRWKDEPPNEGRKFRRVPGT